ncbi:unnamed protein product [Didymodactylos carnosus]|uniref:Uncharacterized protein n=1 Tax=Didymodactylos carnosus TaxID=1234261 RepID=A0A814Q931_9BILA|nr:unnamed protein product [Didymodactylos carnosus]CAF3881086.1 unnamed protein product [Didymodactylos carnosus]
MNTFLSTTFQKDIALLYAGNGLRRPEYESVLFELILFTDIKVRPFSATQRRSYFIDEDELLCAIAAIFRIDSVEEMSNGVSCVKMTLIKEEDKQVLYLMEHFQLSVGQTPSILTFGQVLIRIGHIAKAERYFNILLKQVSPTDPIPD